MHPYITLSVEYVALSNIICAFVMLSRHIHFHSLEIRILQDFIVLKHNIITLNFVTKNLYLLVTAKTSISTSKKQKKSKKYFDRDCNICIHQFG